MNYKRNRLTTGIVLISASLLLSLLLSSCNGSSNIVGSLVWVHADDATGQGIIIDKAGYLVTGGHVVKDSKSISIEMKSGARYEGRIVCFDQIKDLAVIKMFGDYSGLQAATLSDSDLVQVWDDVSVAGYLPGAKNPVISKGTVSAVVKPDGISYIQTNAALNPDSADSAVINKSGEMIGMVSWSYGKAGREGYAIASNEIQNMLILAREAESSPLTIDSIDSPVVSSSSAVISWKTNRPSTSQLEYGLKEGIYGFKTSTDETLLQAHGSVVENLQAVTAYHFRVRSVDCCGNEVLSKDQIFTTTRASSPVGKLAILSINVYDITSSAASVSWITNKPADSTVIYSQGKSSKPGVTANGNQVYAHKIRVNGLQAETHYNISIRSETKDGEVTQADAAPFSTLTIAPVCCKINCRVPDFAFKTLQGADFTNKDIAGKRVFMIFTKTSCPTCMKQAIFLDEIYRTWPQGDMLMIMVASSEKQKDVEEWIAKYGITVPVYLDANADLVNTCKFRTIPSVFFLDTGSIIKDFKSGGFGSKKEMEEALKQFSQ